MPFAPAYFQTTGRLDEFHELTHPAGFSEALQRIDALVQPVNAFASMYWTLVGISMLTRLVFPEKALATIRATDLPLMVEGIDIIVAVPSYPIICTVSPSIDIHLYPSVVVPFSIPYPQVTGRSEEFHVDVQVLGSSSIWQLIFREEQFVNTFAPIVLTL